MPDCEKQMIKKANSSQFSLGCGLAAFLALLAIAAFATMPCGYASGAVQNPAGARAALPAAVPGNGVPAETWTSAHASSTAAALAYQTRRRGEGSQPATLGPDLEDTLFLPPWRFTEQGGLSRPRGSAQHRRLPRAPFTYKSGSRSPPLYRRWI